MFDPFEFRWFLFFSSSSFIQYDNHRWKEKSFTVSPLPTSELEHIGLVQYSPSALAAIEKKRPATTDETPDSSNEAKKPKSEPSDDDESKKSNSEPSGSDSATSIVFKKPLPPPAAAKPKKSALEEIREVRIVYSTSS